MSRRQEIPRDAPNNIEAEQGLLGALLMNNSVMGRVAHILEPEDFFEDVHRRIYDTARELVARDAPVTPVTLRTYLGDEDMGGLKVSQYLARLASEAASVVNAPHYAKIVKDLAVRRRIISIANEAIDAAHEMPVDASPATLLDTIDTALEEVRPGFTKVGGPKRIQEFAREAAERVQAIHRAQTSAAGITTGLPSLDEAIGGGLQRTDLIILGGRPGSGKTSLALNIGTAAARSSARVGVFSMEMGGAQLATRMVAEAARTPSWIYRRGKASAEQLERFVETALDIQFPMWVDQRGALTLTQLASTARSVKKRSGLDLIVIDYIQLMKGAGRSRETNRNQDVSEITMGLKALAKELEVPVLALSQLSRKVEERDNKRPMLSDLRDSGAIEQDADMVLFVYREEYYLDQAKPREGTEAYAKWLADVERARGRAEIIIGKQREGPLSTVHVGFNAALTCFENDPPPLPEAATRSATPREKAREKPLNDESKNALSFLASMLITSGREPPPGAEGFPIVGQVVDYYEWKRVCAERLLDPAAPAKDVDRLMQRVVTALTAHGKIGRGVHEDDSFVWTKASGG